MSPRLRWAAAEKHPVSVCRVCSIRPQYDKPPTRPPLPCRRCLRSLSAFSGQSVILYQRINEPSGATIPDDSTPMTELAEPDRRAYHPGAPGTALFLACMGASPRALWRARLKENSDRYSTRTAISLTWRLFCSSNWAATPHSPLGEITYVGARRPGSMRSCSTLTRCARLRPRRSSFHTTSVSTWRRAFRHASRTSRSSRLPLAEFAIAGLSNGAIAEQVDAACYCKSSTRSLRSSLKHVCCREGG
jgi:hypothetical protein